MEQRKYNPCYNGQYCQYHRVSKIEEYHAEKHRKDSTALAEQQRSLDFYQHQLDSLLPQADSLIALFKYEKNEKREMTDGLNFLL